MKMIAMVCMMVAGVAYAAEVLKAPMAKKVPKSVTMFGDTRVDNYGWIREKSNPAVIAYLNSENDFANATMQKTEPLQKKLYDEMLSHIKQTDVNVPYRKGDYFYYTRTEAGKQYPIFARKKGSVDAPEEIVIDVNKLAEGHKFMSVAAYQPSDDGNLLAYSIVQPRKTDLKYYLDHRGNRFYIMTNDAGINYRVVSAPLDDPSQKNWTEVIAYRKPVKIDSVRAFANHLVMSEREGGLSQLEVLDLRNGQAHRIRFPEPAYTL